MDDLSLVLRLGALEPPEIELRREQAMRSVVTRLQTSAVRRNRRTRLSPRLAAILVSASIAVAGFTLLTPPGQAITSWVGNRLGLGQPGGHPSLRQLRASWTQGTSAEGQPAYVLAVGPAPGEGRYEFITYWPHETKGGRHGGRWNLGEPCFEVELTQERSSYGSDCGVLPEGPNLFVSEGGNGMPGHESFFLSGRASAKVGAVEARVDGEPVDVETVPIPNEFVDRFRLGQPFSFFIAFLHHPPRDGGALTVIARGPTGKVLARHRSETPNFALVQRFACEQAHRVLREGIEKRRNALKNIRATCRASE